MLLTCQNMPSFGYYVLQTSHCDVIEGGQLSFVSRSLHTKSTHKETPVPSAALLQMCSAILLVNLTSHILHHIIIATVLRYAAFWGSFCYYVDQSVAVLHSTTSHPVECLVQSQHKACIQLHAETECVLVWNKDAETAWVKNYSYVSHDLLLIKNPSTYIILSSSHPTRPLWADDRRCPSWRGAKYPSPKSITEPRLPHSTSVYSRTTYNRLFLAERPTGDDETRRRPSPFMAMT